MRGNILQYNVVVTPIFYDKEMLKIKFYSIEEAKTVYGEDSLVAISLLSQIIFYTKNGLQPKFIWESEKEQGKIVAWYHKGESELVYKRWQANKLDNKINNK